MTFPLRPSRKPGVLEVAGCWECWNLMDVVNGLIGSMSVTSVLPSQLRMFRLYVHARQPWRVVVMTCWYSRDEHRACGR